MNDWIGWPRIFLTQEERESRAKKQKVFMIAGFSLAIASLIFKNKIGGQK